MKNIVNNIFRFLYDTSSTMYKKYRQRVDSLRKGMVLESHARKREAEDAGDDIAEGTETSSEKGMCKTGTAMNE